MGGGLACYVLVVEWGLNGIFARDPLGSGFG